MGGPYTNGAGRAKFRRRDRADGGPPRARELRPGAEPPLNVVDDNRNRPPHFSAEERSWVSEHVLPAPSPAVRTHLCVIAGRFDGPAGQTVA